MKLTVNVDALNLAKETLINEFSWALSPQGQSYWSVANNCLSEVGYAAGVRLNKSSKISPPWPPAEGTCEKIINSLGVAFTWSDTIHGFNYWADVHDALKEVRKFEVGMKSSSFEDYDRAMRGI